MLPYYQDQTISYQYQKHVFECYKNGKKTADSTEAPKLTKDIDTGRAGVVWNGTVQCLIYSITIEGKLDSDWIAKELGRK